MAHMSSDSLSGTRPKSPRSGSSTEPRRQFASTRSLGSLPKQTSSESVHTGETKILEMIARGRPLTEVLDALTRFIDSQAEGIHCSIAFIDAELRIRPASAPSLPPEYNGKLDGVPIFPYIGPCGMAAYLKQQIISEDIDADERWSDGFRSITKKHGLRACWSTPIFDSRRSVIGTFAVYLEHPSAPAVDHLQLIEVATRVAGIAIERQLREERLHLGAEIIEKSTEAIRIADQSGRIVEQNAAHREMFGIPDTALKGQTLAAIVGEEQAVRVLASLSQTERFNGELVAMVNGTPRLIDTSVFAVKNHDGKVACHVALSRDVTEKRNAEEALRTSHAELESLVAQRTVALRTLSQHLLKMQDEERRRVARDLHDSTGQTLASLKMSLANLQERFKEDHSTSRELLALAEITDRALQEIRTTSYLLHPPLLDEAGFASAAQWYVEGFAQRSGTQVRFELPRHLGRMPGAVEITLFRILQESLTNVHRHSRSSKVDIQVDVSDHIVAMMIKDFGCGIPADVLRRFQTSGSNVGVGLVGMRERVHELGGQLDIQAGSDGTTIMVQIPLTPALHVVA